MVLPKILVLTACTFATASGPATAATEKRREWRPRSLRLLPWPGEDGTEESGAGASELRAMLSEGELARLGWQSGMVCVVQTSDPGG